MKKQWKKQVQTWTNLNPGWEYGFLSDDGSSQYVEEHFSEHTTIHNFWRELNVTILRADLIRYLAMLADGGVYSDMDTSCLKPIGDWIPPEFSESEIGIVAGIEYDDNTYPMFARPISICQWTLMARPGHAVFEKVVARVIYHLEYLARIKHVQLSELKLNKKEVLDATGPGAFTDSIMEVISEHERRKVSWKELSQLKQAKLFGDVLILPVNAFAGNQKHSHSGRPEFGPKLVTHHFGRSWYKRPEDVPKKTEPMKTKKEDLFETHRSQRGHRLQS
ncbi:Initiation-specific alpha-1,6-mannosyltransferase [Pseudocercospora fuligena]|uniref:Initiation-specific alpha-1,6-mannosyltransferase n=1 Tax=Pseudocercospora fuligena TaxID=685502 RepID=A0A8H6VKY8_9PEZI|nr:Initiation-specific alpha-1,6-mannosyltransferase [Pseudocercospora fuligena]